MRTAALVAFAVVTSLASLAVAQPAPGGEIEVGNDATPPPAAPAQKDPKQAKKFFAAGQQALAKGDALAKKKPDDAKQQYDVAEQSFLRATQLGDDINVYFYLATAQQKLGKFVDAVRSYRMVLRAQAGVDPRLQKQVSGKLDEVMGQVGTLSLVVTPDGANIALAGESVGVSPLPEPLVLMPGAYTFAISAPGYEPKQQEIKIEAGSESEKKITLESVKVVIEKPRKVTSDEVDKPDAPKKPSMIPVYVGAGVSGGFLIATIVSGSLALSNHSKFVDANTSPNGRLDAKDAGVGYAHLSDVCLAGTVVAAGFAAYWYVFQYRKQINHHESDVGKLSKVDLVPWVEPATTATGLTVLGRF